MISKFHIVMSWFYCLDSTPFGTRFNNAREENPNFCDPIESQIHNPISFSQALAFFNVHVIISEKCTCVLLFLHNSNGTNVIS